MNRATLGDDFASSTRRSPWKTFVLEAHADNDVDGLLTDAFGKVHVSDTDDVHLHQVDDDVRFVVDHLDDRFWSLHTKAPTSVASPFLKRIVEARRDLDWMWLPSDHLREVWPGARPHWVSTDFTAGRLTPAEDEVADLKLRVRGGAAEGILHLIESKYAKAVSFSGVAITAADDDFGSVAEAISRDGRFVAKGDDFGFHQTIVRHVVDRYRHFVEAVETRALRWVELPGGGAQLHGSPVVLRFSQPIPDLELFLERLFSAREPFRLWGMPQMTGDRSAEVEAVDLHVGQQLRFDITSDWLRIYLFEGGCGNTVARLISNLQHHLDGALSIIDGELDAGLKQPG
jgi:hypothetical protein